jgi:hypothetical protein
MARITIEADTPEELADFMRRWVKDGSQGVAVDGPAAMTDETDKFSAALRRMTPLTRELVVAIAEASRGGGRLVLNADTLRRFGKSDGGQLGGAFANIWRAFSTTVQRDVLIHVRIFPAEYHFTKADAELILAAAKKILNG